MKTVPLDGQPGRDLQEDFSLAVFGSSDGLCDWDIGGGTVSYSTRWKAMLGYADHEIGTGFEEWQSRIHPDDVERAQAVLDACLSNTAAHYELEHRMQHRDGGYRWILARGMALRDMNGEPYWMAVSHTDITERKGAEERLRASEELYRALVRTSPDSIVLIDLDGTILMANNRAAELYGYATAEEMIGLDVRELLTPEDRERAQEGIGSVAKLGCLRDQEYRLRRKDGTTFPAELSAALITGTDGRPRAIVSVGRDISERKRAEKRLRERDELLEKRVMERTRELSTLLEVSRQIASTLQIEPLLGLILDQLREVVEYRGGSLFKLRENALTLVEYRGPIPREQVVGLTFALGQIGPIWQLAEEGRPVMIGDVRGDDPLARTFRDAIGGVVDSGLDGDWSYIRSWMAVPLMQKGKAVGLLGLSTDQPHFYNEEQAHLATALASQVAVAMDNAKLYKQAQEAAALEERARLARELHDSVTQALFSMTMHAEAAQLALERNPESQTDDRLARNLRELRDLTTGALAEMRALIFELRPGALQEEGLVAALQKHTAALSAREGLRVEVQAPEHRVAMDPSVEEHVYRCAQEALHNVVKHAGAGKAQVRLAAASADLQGTQTGCRTLVLEIEDDGAGFDPAKIPAGHLGVRTMGDRVEQIGGSLEIRSAPGAGTTVRILAPCGVQAAEGAAHG